MIVVAMNVMDLMKINAFHVIIIVMVVIYKKAHINVLLNVRSINIQIQQIGR